MLVMRRAKIGSSWLAVLTLASSCFSSGDSSDSTSIPDIHIECESAQANDCMGAASGKTAYVGLISDLSIICSIYLNGRTASDFPVYFDVSGHTTTYTSSTYTVGMVDEWTDSQGVAAVTVRKDTYRVCAFIDTNNNGRIDDGEPYGEGEITLPNDSVDSVTFWENF